MSIMSLVKRTKLLLRRYGIFPKQHLGQNFIVDPSIFQRLTAYASLNRNDVVLDIGAGLGFLTRFLAEKCKRVLAVELDSRLVKVLREQLGNLTNVSIIKGDVLKAQIPHFNKVVSAPPYYISSSLLLWLFGKKFQIAVLILQKEFAHRLVASIGSEDYGWLTVVTYYHAEPELLREVPRRIFFPQPDVDSMIVRLKPKKPLPFTLKNKGMFKRFVQALFTQRNRKVRNGILPYIKSRSIATEGNAVKLADSLPFHNKRIRELAPEDFGELANALTK